MLVMWLLVFLLPLSAAGDTPSQNDTALLAPLLDKCAGYCERLKGAIFHFYCRETVTEITEKKLHYPENRRGLKNFLERNRNRSQSEYQYDAHKYQDMRRMRDSYKSLQGGVKVFFTYDYQIIQVGGQIQERRILLTVEKDKKTYKKSNYTPILYSYKNAMVPIYFLSHENQPLYRYTLGGKDRVLGRKCHMVLVFAAKSGPEAPPLARIWIDSADFSVLKFTVFPGAIKGYDQLMRLEGRKLSNLEVQDVHEFGLVRDGIRYPTRTRITLSYTSELKNVMTNRSGGGSVKIGAVLKTRLTTEVRYKRYRFFEVTVARPVFKQVDSL